LVDADLTANGQVSIADKGPAEMVPFIVEETARPSGDRERGDRCAVAGARAWMARTRRSGWRVAPDREVAERPMSWWTLMALPRPPRRRCRRPCRLHAAFPA